MCSESLIENLLPLSGPSRDEIQAEAIAAILAERAKGVKSTILQMPTQTGKTRTIVKLIKQLITEESGRYLILADRGELLDQFAAELHAYGIPFRVEKAKERAGYAMAAFPEYRVCLGSKDSFQDRKNQKPRLTSWPAGFFDIIFQDECDLCPAATWQAIHEHFTAFRVGMTATIDRLDGVPLSTCFESTAYNYKLVDAIENGHRAAFMQVQCEMEVDIRGIKANKEGVLNPGELEARLALVLKELANAVRQEVERLGIEQFICFLPDVRSSYDFAHALEGVGIPSKAVDGKNPHRREIVADFKAGGFRGLCNNQLFGRGFNHPGIGAVVHLCPTTSRARFDQMSGRCGATAPGKTYGYLLFFGWQSEHDLIGPTDIFAEDCSERVRQKARQLGRNQKDADPEELVRQAKELVDLEEKAEREHEAHERRLRLVIGKKDVNYRRIEFNPLGVKKVFGCPIEYTTARDSGEPASDTQKQMLKERGITGFDRITKATAAGILATLLDRELRRLATPEQVRKLLRRGITPQMAKLMSEGQAKAFLDRPQPVSPKMRWWLRQQGYRNEAIDAMDMSQAMQIRAQHEQRRKAAY
jgi:superfamily II DNA or RNA helicase